MFENGFPKKWSTLRKLAWLFRTVINAVIPVEKTVIGNPIHITDALAKPVQALSIVLEPIQSGSGDPSPDNIRPIYGHTDADVTRTGKNLLADEDIYVGKNYNGNDNAQRSMIYVQAPIGEYTVSVQDKTSFAELNIGRTNMVYGTMNSMHGIVGTPETSWTITTNEQYPIICVFLRNASDAMTLEQINAAQIQVELGSTASSSYSPYVGTTYPIPLGQTVYGATVDTVNGNMTLEWIFYEYDGDEGWISGASYFGLFNQQPSVGNNDLTQIANWLKGAGNNYADYGGFRAQSNGAVVVGKTGGPWADTNAFKATLAQTPLQVCYKLATPITIQLTPTQVELLQGENNLWSDGTMTLTYLADGNASDAEALNILLGGRYVNNHGEDEPTDREALDILLGGTR